MRKYYNVQYNINFKDENQEIIYIGNEKIFASDENIENIENKIFDLYFKNLYDNIIYSNFCTTDVTQKVISCIEENILIKHKFLTTILLIENNKIKPLRLKNIKI